MKIKMAFNSVNLRISKVILLLVLFTISPMLNASRLAGPKKTTEGLLKSAYDSLERFRKGCGHFPLTGEVNDFLKSDKAYLKCPASEHEWGIAKYDLAKDGWGEKLIYTSDGKTYKIEASHGYSVTEHSPKHINDNWDNPNPPPDDPPPTYTDGPNTVTRSNFQYFFAYLETFQKMCGRFPLTSEGLGALATPPVGLVCDPHFKAIHHSKKEVSRLSIDGFKKKMKYTSDGKTYKIEASHGYFVTDHSEEKGGPRWENTGVAPEDPKKLIPQSELDLM